ncbi:hypothetical protein H4S02_010030 [Coemansia sp. RSA 2611]|nr:hypothetical protein H4S02_010030 [Coemansia sp. RSA 2611]
MVYNYDSELMSPTSASDNVTIPLVVIKSDDGQAILSELNFGHVTVTATNRTMSAPNPAGGQISHFSSWGPDPELYLSPAVGAPGGNIFSTFPLALGGYTSLSGTSMASPYVAGMAALILQAKSKKISVGEVRRLILESARPAVDANSTALLSPLRQGSGLANIWDAIAALATIDPPQLSLNYTELGAQSSTNAGDSTATDGLDGVTIVKRARASPLARPTTQWPIQMVRTLTLRNNSPTNFLTCTMTNLPASAVSSFMANGSFTATPRTWPESNNTTAVARDTQPQAFVEGPALPIRVAPGDSQRISVRIIAPTGLSQKDKWFYSGYLRFNLLWDDQVGTAQSLHVPYMGFLGDYTKLDILSSPDEGLPFVSLRGSTDAIADDDHLLIDAAHRLSVHYRLEHPTRLLKMQLVDEENVPQGYLPYGYLEYLGRNYQGGSSHYSNSTINGTLYHDADLTRPFATAPGTYRVRIDALRPLRSPSDPDGFQTWISPKFVLDSVSLVKNATADKLEVGDSVNYGEY